MRPFNTVMALDEVPYVGTSALSAMLSYASSIGMLETADWCAQEGWYGDGICDASCVQPDPDCD